MKQFLPIAFVLMGASVAAAEGQSLADVARKEAERRERVTAPGRLYTNKDLSRVPSRITERTVPAASGPAPASPAPPAQQNGVGSPSVAAATDDTEQGWRARVDARRDALARAEIVAAALQSRINALTTDSINRDDPAQRAVLLADRDAAVRELERVQQDIAAGNAALEATLEEARRAGIPAGWVRERPR